VVPRDFPQIRRRRNRTKAQGEAKRNPLLRSLTPSASLLKMHNCRAFFTLSRYERAVIGPSFNKADSQEALLAITRGCKKKHKHIMAAPFLRKVVLRVPATPNRKTSVKASRWQIGNKSFNRPAIEAQVSNLSWGYVRHLHQPLPSIALTNANR